MSFQTASVRTVAFVGHPSSGKTTLIDALAWQLGASDRKGSVADKTSICDTEPEEQEKGHTLQAKLVHAAKGGISYTFADTPGYPEFMAEAISASFGTDMTVGVVSATSGVTFNLRRRMATAAQLGRARAVIATHVDAENTDFAALVEKLGAALGEECVPMLVPNASGPRFSAVSWVMGAGDEAWRRRLYDRVMDACEDEALLERYLETETLSEQELAAHLPKAIVKGKLVPILACNPHSGVGLEQVLEFFAKYAPSPATAPGFAVGEAAVPVPLDPAGALLGLVFQVRSDPHVGKICFARILRGTVKSTDYLCGKAGAEKGEKLGGLFHAVGGKKRENADSAGPGEIIALSKVEGLNWGDTFTVAGHRPEPAHAPAMPRPMVAMAVTPKSRADEQKISDALHKLCVEDRTLRLDHSAETHELVLSGMSDLHLKVVESRLKRRYGVEIAMSLPRIAYRETITKAVDSHYRHKKQTGGRGQFGECYLKLRPATKDAGVVFVDDVVGGSIPRNLIPAVEKGVREAAARGVLTHSFVTDIEVAVYDGKYHEVDSDEASFKIAGARAFKEGVLKAAPVLLEPVMEVEIHVPTDSAGAIFSDITSHRRGHVFDQTTEEDGHVTVIKAHAPLVTIQAYDRDLKSQTAGEGSFSMRFERYAPMPMGEQQRIVAQIARTHEEE